MKQFLKLRVLPVFLVVSLMLSFCAVPAVAADNFPSSMRDYDSVEDWEAKLKPNAMFVSTVADLLNISADSSTVFWAFVNRVISPEIVGPVHLGALTSTCESYNWIFNTSPQKSFLSELFAGSYEVFSDSLAFLLLGTFKLNFVVKRDPETGAQRIYEEVTGIWVVDSAGRYPYVEGPSDTGGGNQWIDLSLILAKVKSETSIPTPFSGQALMNLCANLVAANVQCQIMQISDKYKAICTNDGDFVYCNADGQPFVAFVDDDAWSVNQDRDDTIVKDEEGNVIEGLPEDVTSGIDLDNMLIYLPNGTIGIIDNLTYDESTKTYNVDSHDVYNNYYYYHYEYHINYTSITYIGQTEEYDKYYEVYYELPDGRDSADLTKEDLEQLNLAIDVIPYGRSADDTSLRSLYHFDGDTRDVSYWNYCTDFVWNEGSTLTYMDAGVFEGALYLDEQEHDFTMLLPSNITADDFTLQWRYYQSYTAAPVTDSYLNFGDLTVLEWSGGYFSDPDGTALHVTPTGTWNEVALIRDSGTIYYYLNGVCMGSWRSTISYRDTITFHFGDEQQTYKYFDEFRFLNYALQSGGRNYTPSAVPHDTNLALVLPGTATPVADEYWSITNTPGYLSYIDFTQGAEPSNVHALEYFEDGPDYPFPEWCFTDELFDIQYFDNYAELNRTGADTLFMSGGYARGGFYSNVAYYKDIKPTATTSEYYGGFTQLQDYTMTIVYRDGTIEKIPLTYEDLDVDDRSICAKSFTYGTVYVYRYSMSGYMRTYITIWPRQNTPFEVVGIEVCVGESQLKAEWVESVTSIDTANMKSPTLAVRTDLDITSYQIGGVRPSVPEKGMVWALVENQRITSLQIYNGQAWEGVDGRIWTGSRWIPASSYNIITLQDMYDIVDATPDYEYIYTESGFWSWWQKSWIAFTEQLFASLGSSGAGGSNNLDGVDLESQDPELIPEEEDGKSFWQFVMLLIVGGKSVVGGVREITSGAVSSVPDSVNDIVAAFGSGGLAVGVMDGSYMDPDAADLPQDDSGEAALVEVEEVDPWRYR